MRKELKAGQKVRLDKDKANTSVVEVVSQSPGKLYTVVKGEGNEGHVMTDRLSELAGSTKDNFLSFKEIEAKVNRLETLNHIDELLYVCSPDDKNREQMFRELVYKAVNQ